MMPVEINTFILAEFRWFGGRVGRQDYHIGCQCQSQICDAPFPSRYLPRERRETWYWKSTFTCFPPSEQNPSTLVNALYEF